MSTLYEDDLQKIIVISEKIIKIYNKLYNLEIDNKKETNLYKKNLSYLNLLIELEDEIYSHISEDNLSLFIDIIKESDPNTKLNDFSLLINDKYNSYVYKRILNNLRYENNKRLINLFEKEDNETMINSLLLDNLILEDIINAFIFETELSIKKTDNINYKNSFKMIKYLLSYLNKSTENNLKNGFSIPNKLFLTSTILIDNQDNYKKKVREHYIEYINKEVYELGKDDIYNSSYSYLDYKKILQINLIKAYLALDNKNIILNNKIYDKIEKDNIDLQELLNYHNKNILLLKSERLNIYGDSKRF